MRCRRARTAIVERRLGLLPAVVLQELEDHLRGCPACREEAADERAVATILGSLRGSAPPRVDVAARVMREVDRLGTVARQEVSRKQIAWAALGATAALAAIVAVGFTNLPSMLPGAVRETRWILGGFGALFPALGKIAGALLVAAQSLGGIALGLLDTAGRILGRFAAVSQAVTAFSVFVMMTITTYVIGKDLRVFPAATARKERS